MPDRRSPLRQAHERRGAPIAATRQVGDTRSRPPTLAEQEGITDAYVCRLVPLTCLVPDIVEAILDGRQPKGLRLADVLGNGPLAWNAQRKTWGFSN
jgi:hypothetical protein